MCFSLADLSFFIYIILLHHFKQSSILRFKHTLVFLSGLRCSLHLSVCLHYWSFPFNTSSPDSSLALKIVYMYWSTVVICDFKINIHCMTYKTQYQSFLKRLGKSELYKIIIPFMLLEACHLLPLLMTSPCVVLFVITIFTDGAELLNTDQY